MVSTCQPAAGPKAVSYDKSERLLVAFIVGLALLARVYSGLTVPVWQGPDEPKHFEYARLLVDKRATLIAERRLLTPSDVSPPLQSQIISSLAQHDYWQRVGWLPSGGTIPEPLPKTFAEIWPHGTHTQLHRPSLYYLLAGITLLPMQSLPLEGQVLALRLLSALLGAITVFLTYITCRLALPGNRYLPPSAAAFAAGLPMFVFIGGTVNNDNLVAMSGALVSLGLVWILRGTGGVGWCLTIAAFAVALASKRTAVGLAPAIAAAFLFWLASIRNRILVGAVGVVAIACVAVLTAGPFDPGSQTRDAVAAYALNGIHQWNSLVSLPWFASETQALLVRHCAALFASFWGIFGWFNVLLDVPFYALFAVASGAAGIGIAKSLAGRGVELGAKGSRETVAVLLAAAVGAIVLALLERLPYLSPHELPQGRYLFVALVPLVILHSLGWQSILPRRWCDGSGFTLATVIFFIALNLIVYALYIGPFYAGQ